MSSLINGGPSIVVLDSDSKLISYVNSLSGNTFTTIEECFIWLKQQDNMFIQNKPFNNITMSGLTFYLDGSHIESYPLSGDTCYDLSGGNSGSFVNNTIFENNYFVFDGTNDWISFGDINSYMDSCSITFYSNDNINYTSEGQNLINFSVQDSNNYGLIDLGQATALFNNEVITLVLKVDNVLWRSSIVSTSFTISQGWHNITISKGGDNGYRIYYDGVQVDNTEYGTNPPSIICNNVLLSKYDNLERYLNGKISNVMIYNRSLSEEEILKNYYHSSIVTDGLIYYVDASNLISYESGSTSVYNLTGGTTGTLTNGVSYNGLSWVFDGNDDYIDYGDNSLFDFGFNDFSISAWIYLDGVGEDTLRSILSKRGSGWGNGWQFIVNSSNFLQFTLLGQDSSETDSITQTSPITHNKWINTVVTVGRYTQFDLYIDGINIMTKEVLNSNVVDLTTFRDANIGAVANLYYIFNGMISNLSIYNRKLTSKEVYDNYHAQKNKFI